ncbi:PadR family transcriptional regulator [Paenibacillus tyrfis]|uniref:PadR family transcriptional regulator n=1 Tax=Paenibacillus tyrfis TaxID=1501230 RepID=UPI00209F2E69|nr:PadR family transcriptional regulator [Paenibacillus tyrfis]MCP1310727.1 PadR family transcriptional regulator [Paenibacillus tyrfis]
MYDLFVLGELMIGDTHGYQLQERLKRAVGPVRQISSGTLYPLLSRLVEHGWISLRLEEQEGGRARKIYKLTEAGRERFFELMDSPLDYTAETELMFHFKMSNFPFVTKEVRLASLEQYLNYLQHNLKYVDSVARMISSKKMDERKRAQVLRMLDHRKHVGLADAEWVSKELERLKAAEE